MTANETMKIRNEAANYAKAFLVMKYNQEYQELYDAFLNNRGINTRRSRVLTDERTIGNE
jgi:hypothetical protein